MTPLGGVVGGSIEPENAAQVKRLPSCDGFEESGISSGADLERGFLFFVTVGSGDVEVVPDD